MALFCARTMMQAEIFTKLKREKKNNRQHNRIDENCFYSD